MWLVRERLGEDAELLCRDSATVRGLPAAAGLVRGGLHPEEVGRAVRRTGARIVHAHNLHPTFGWRALAAARAAGAAVVLHLHQYRMVCAIGICFRAGHDCTSCHGRNTLPGVWHDCRGAAAEAAAYGVGLAAWQRRLAGQADAFVVPSHFAEARLRELGAPLGPTFVVPNVIHEIAPGPPDPPGTTALLASRLVPEKGIGVAVQACRLAGIPLVVAGEGPERARLEAEATADGVGGAAPPVTFAGRVGPDTLATLRGQAAVALVPSLSAETFGLAAAEAMAAGVPVAASRVGALPELVPEPWLAAPGDPFDLARAIRRLRADTAAPEVALRAVRAAAAPEVAAPALAAAYAHAEAHTRR